MLRTFPLLTLVILLIATRSYAQQEVVLAKYKNQLKLSPFRIIDIRNPGFELSYERIYLKRLSTQISGAYMTSVIPVYPQNYKGYRLALEEKYFYYRAKQLATYVSLDFVYCKSEYINDYNFVSGDDITNANQKYADTVTIHKKMATLNLKGGIQFTLNRFVTDICVGIGIKHRHIEEYDRLHPEDSRYVLADTDFFHFIQTHPGDMLLINFPLNIKLGFLF